MVSPIMHSIKKIIRLNLLTILTLSGVIIGFILGIILMNSRNNIYTSREIAYVYFIGDIFLRILKALILPLIISSLISAIGSLDLTLSGKIGGRAIIYYIITTVMAVILGIILVQTIQPGKTNSNNDDGTNNIENKISSSSNNNKKRNITTADTLLDLIRNMFPPNLVQACTKQYQTVLKPPENFTSDLLKWKVTGEFVEGMNILGLVVASIVFGIALSSIKTEVPTLLNIFNDTSKIMMKITGWVIWLSPVGVIFLICSKVIELENLDDLFGKLGLFFITVAGGILFHGFIILPFIFFLFTRKNPYKFIANMSQAMATAFGTASSSATLPVTINCLEEKNNIDSRVARFVLPIGATINMDGTALYEAVAALFIAQIRDVDLTFGSIIAVSITATAASIGAAGIPQAGLVTMVMVLDTIGLPAEDISLVIAVDWLLDRIRTVVNVLGDSFGAGIVSFLSQDELKINKEKPNSTENLNNKNHTTTTLIENGNDSTVITEYL